MKNSLVSRSLPCGLAVPACLPPRAGTLRPRAARIADPCRAEKESPGGEILKEKQPRRKADDHHCDNSKKQSTWSTPQKPPAPEEWKRSLKMGNPGPINRTATLHAQQGLHHPDIQQSPHAPRQDPIARSSRIRVKRLPNNRPPPQVPTKREKSKRAGTRTPDGGSGRVQSIRVDEPDVHLLQQWCETQSA